MPSAKYIKDPCSKDSQPKKSKISQEGRDKEKGSEVHLDLPCGRQKTNTINIIVERILLLTL